MPYIDLWLMPMSCHFRHCKALPVASLTHVRSAIASTRPLPLPIPLLPDVRLMSGGLAYLVTSLVASTKLINAGPG